MTNFEKPYVIRRPFPKIYDDVIFVSERSMKDLLAEDLKDVKKRYDKQLNYIGLDNEMLSLNLKNKDHDYKKLHDQYKTLQFRCEVLEQEKKSLERKLEAEVRTSIQLRRQVSSLRWTKNNMQEHVDRIQSQYTHDIRKLIDKRHH